MKVLITGAAGNLGSIFARHLVAHTAHSLWLMAHRKDVAEDLMDSPRTTVVKADLSLQDFLQIASEEWGTRPPWKMPLWMIYTAAGACELWGRLFNTVSPLTRDFIDIGRVSYYGDTSRMKQDLLPELRFPTIEDGRGTLAR